MIGTDACKDMAEYMLDTSAVGEIENGAVDPRLLYTSSDALYITHIQEDELANAGHYSKFLMRVLDVVDAGSVATESFKLGISKLGRGKLGAGKYEQKILNEMKPDGGNEMLDAMIADAAVVNGHTLVTHDEELRDAVNDVTPGEAISMSEFRTRLH